MSQNLCKFNNNLYLVHLDLRYISSKSLKSQTNTKSLLKLNLLVVGGVVVAIKKNDLI